MELTKQQVKGLKVKIGKVVQFEAESIPAWLVCTLIITIAIVVLSIVA